LLFDAIALTVRLLFHLIAAISALAICLFAAFGAMIALDGTGGFTADPPPDHPSYLGAALALLICVALEVLLYLAWRALIRAMDSFEDWLDAAANK
jgi:hypothetical protein